MARNANDKELPSEKKYLKSNMTKSLFKTLKRLGNFFVLLWMRNKEK